MARPGTFTDYHFEPTSVLDDLGMFVTWEMAPEFGWIYPAFNFSFEVQQGGYIGLQLVGNERKAIFSIWDLPGQPDSAIAVVAHGVRFGNEGEGAKCLIDFNWEAGREYCLQVASIETTSEGVFWEGTIHDAVSGDTTVIGRILLKNSMGFAGYGKLRPCAYTFVEYFNGPMTCENQPHSQVRWRGPMANGGAILASKANVAHYSECSQNNVRFISEGVVIHETGGSVVKTTPPHTPLW